MKTQHVTGLLAAGLMAMALTVGCSSEESTDAETTSETQTTYGKTVEKAQETVAALANPKVGIDPVCAMAIDDEAVIVTLNDQKYGVCSNSCAEKLKADPDKYLVASHTDHDHDH